MKILDATCGSKSIWYEKNHPLVTYMDIRRCSANSKHRIGKRRRYKINPDVVSSWKDAPWPENTFDMIIFDPPHLIRKHEWSDSSMVIRYGKLYQDTWKQELKEGIDKLFDILKPKGIFILKWCETDKPIEEIIKLFPYRPLFGTRTGQANKNHWIVFLKYRLDKKLDIT